LVTIAPASTEPASAALAGTPQAAQTKKQQQSAPPTRIFRAIRTMSYFTTGRAICLALFSDW
jgi:hypothetical protein